MKSMLISLGQAASHSRWLVQEPKYSSITSTIASVRRERSGWPWGNRFRWASLAAVKSWPAPFGHAATQAPQPMQAAASIARSAFSFGTAIRFASGAEPVGAVMKPPDSMMRSNAPRSTTRSLMIGKPAARQGSTVIVSPSANGPACAAGRSPCRAEGHGPGRRSSARTSRRCPRGSRTRTPPVHGPRP